MGREGIRAGFSTFAGVIFSVAWWLWVDAHIWSVHISKVDPENAPPKILFYYYIPAIVGTFALIMTNIIEMDSLNPYSWYFDEGTGAKVKVWLFFSFILSFSSVISAIYIMAKVFLPSNGQYPGIAIAVSNFTIFLSSIILLYSRTNKPSEYEGI